MRKAPVLFAILILALSGYASPGSEIIFQAQVPGIDNVISIDPIISSTNQVCGLILADSLSKKITIIGPDGTVTDSLVTNFAPLKAIHRFSSDSDTLIIYLLTLNQYGWPGIAEVKLDQNSMLSGYLMKRSSAFDCLPISLLYGDVRFAEPPLSDTLVTLATTLYMVCYNFTISYSWEVDCRVFSYYPGLQSLVGPFPNWTMITDFKRGDFSPETGIETSAFTTFKWGYQYNDPWDPPPSFDSGSYFYLKKADGQNLYYDFVENERVFRIFAGQFDNRDIYDETIVFGRGVGFGTIGHSASYYAACYGFAAGTPLEKWYTALSNIDLQYLSNSKEVIYGLKGNDSVATLNCRTGALYQSLPLGRSLKAVRIFEDTDSALCLVGRSADTLFVYRFQEPTDAPVDPSGNLPTEYALFQNFPNPFNSSTKIRFSLPASAKVSVEIYNILGVRVRKLVDKRLAGGQHTVVWDGHDENGNQLANGVYFCRMQTEEWKALRKIVLLK